MKVHLMFQKTTFISLFQTRRKSDFPLYFRLPSCFSACPSLMFFSDVQGHKSSVPIKEHTLNLQPLFNLNQDAAFPTFRENMPTQSHTHFVFKAMDVSLNYPPQQPTLPSATLLTNDGFPLPIGLCDLIGTAHFAERHAADDEYHDTWPSAVLSGCLVLVPVAVPSTAGKH